ncbi:HpcH/HpaI aldolase/citrate lyase family protein [Microbacterium sp. RD1]|uniref:HpcH/HpaI aldolase/citrate lyase family protein n=1 Tax=Microbacterium sp. RD1 TaxID=3457313 RepID=UPI003FA552FB
MTRCLSAVARARTFLFVPGNRPDRFGKAAAAGADVVIVDLEDAVAAGDKDSARAEAAAWLSGDGLAAVRIGSGPGEAGSDLAAVAGAPGLSGVIVPKAESAAQLRAVREAVPAGTAVLALVETAAGIAAAREIALSADRLALGTVDLALDLDLAPGSPALDIAAFEVVLASRLAALPAPVASVTTGIGDGAAAGRDAARARAHGYGAKLCIHPAQVGPVSAAFLPDDEERAWARRVVAAAGDGAAAQVDGAMVDRPVLERALRVLEDDGDRPIVR